MATYYIVNSYSLIVTPSNGHLTLVALYMTFAFFFPSSLPSHYLIRSYLAHEQKPENISKTIELTCLFSTGDSRNEHFLKEDSSK